MYEYLAIVWGLGTFRHFLIGQAFEFLMDHSALWWLQHEKGEVCSCIDGKLSLSSISTLFYVILGNRETIWMNCLACIDPSI